MVLFNAGARMRWVHKEFRVPTIWYLLGSRILRLDARLPILRIARCQLVVRRVLMAG